MILAPSGVGAEGGNVDAIVDSIEIDRSPEGVIAPFDDLDRHGEWQDQIVSTRVETDGPIGVGTRVTNTRRMPGWHP